MITVAALPDPVDPPEPQPPKYELKVAKQRVKVGANLLYTPAITENTYDPLTYTMTMSAQLGSASSFATFT